MAHRLAAVVAAAFMLVGCSWLTRTAAPQQWVPFPAPPGDEERALRPGPGPVVVEGIARHSARIAWKSHWQGDSIVRFGRTPVLEAASATPPTAETRVALAGLAPRTRYFFRVETRTVHGVARSPICSFMTR